MLLTNDGELANKLAHPRFGVEKLYRVVVAGSPTREVLNQLVEGIWLAEGKVRAKSVRAVGKRGESTILELVLAEGKNREVRRMLAKLGHKVMTLTRVAVGPITIKGLTAGQFRSLTGKEVDLLRRVAAGQPVPMPWMNDRKPRREPERDRPRRPAASPQSSRQDRPDRRWASLAPVLEADRVRRADLRAVPMALGPALVGWLGPQTARDFPRILESGRPIVPRPGRRPGPRPGGSLSGHAPGRRDYDNGPPRREYDDRPPRPGGPRQFRENGPRPPYRPGDDRRPGPRPGGYGQGRRDEGEGPPRPGGPRQFRENGPRPSHRPGDDRRPGPRPGRLGAPGVAGTRARVPPRVGRPSPVPGEWTASFEPTWGRSPARPSIQRLGTIRRPKAGPSAEPGAASSSSDRDGVGTDTASRLQLGAWSRRPAQASDEAPARQASGPSTVRRVQAEAETPEIE